MIIPSNINTTGVHQLIEVLNHFNKQSQGVIEYFTQHTSTCNFRKGQLILQAGTVCDYFYFIQKGAVRGFIRDAGKELTTWITAENEIATSIYSLDLEIPALENIEAIEDCEMLKMTSKAMQELYNQFPEFNITGRKLLQHYYRDAEARAYIVRLTSAEKKYKHFIEKYNHLANRIPLKYIASYLGITIETLSRVRKKLSST